VDKPRILFFDIETLPNVSYTWGKYDQNVLKFVKQSCLATFAAKWQGDSNVLVKGLPDYKGYQPGSYDDRLLTKDLWNLFNEADILVAHNGDDFDIRVTQGRFLFHGFVPPSPFKTVDTKKVARRAFRFNSNKMDDLGEMLGLGRKIKTDFELWEGCINGDLESWTKMKEYNVQDVILLEKVYNKMLPYMTQHPNFTMGRTACPKCGSESIKFEVIQPAITRAYKLFRCLDCGGWSRLVKSEKTGAAVITNVG
jgi:uncharacterized protein YprB with RNaseH-like and TPR domain